ncbi:hypothetical protein CEXT_86391 [Caerostris extrusa]|uniref:Uncharacterized protein n=1 Tax=Caerostris extrusa TaxID=172846 RepID=A0AAV4XRY7_CAEEX|nr:hypothetical protein CEXT_86391 [Caerostris extrusa]
MRTYYRHHHFRWQFWWCKRFISDAKHFYFFLIRKEIEVHGSNIRDLQTDGNRTPYGVHTYLESEDTTTCECITHTHTYVLEVERKCKRVYLL